MAEIFKKKKSKLGNYKSLLLTCILTSDITLVPIYALKCDLINCLIVQVLGLSVSIKSIHVIRKIYSYL